MADEIINKVAQSGIITLDLEQIIPDMEVVGLDIKDQLFQGLILREKDFRQFVKENDWSVYKDKAVAIYCSVDAIVPTWAYMLLSSALRPYTAEIYFCTPEVAHAILAERFTSALDISGMEGARVVIKGCGDREVSTHAYVALSNRLLPVVKSLMFGEPCSTVPIYKKK